MSAKRAPLKPLTIKLATKAEIPTSYFDDTWSKLHGALQAIFSKRSGEYSQEELYSMVEDLCMHKFGAQLYTHLVAQVEAHLASAFAVSDAPNEVIPSLSKKWSEFTDEMRAIRLVFLYLDRSIKSLSASGDHAMSRSLWDMGLKLFRKRLEAVPRLLDATVSAILEVIEQERSSGLDFDETHHYELVRMLGLLGMNATHLEPQLLAASAAFYERDSDAHVQTDRVPDYLLYVERCMRAEQARGMKFLDSTRRPLARVVEQALVAAHAQVLVDKGLAELLDDENRREDLARMYRLLVQVGEQARLVQAFLAHTKAKGMAVVSDDNADDMVGQLVAFKTRVDSAVRDAFGNDAQCHKAVRDAFEHFLNTHDNKPAELIAKFIDRQLRSTASIDDVQQALSRCTELFRHLHAKDVFEEFYKQTLAKRLLIGTSSSDDLERVMVSHLKSECGANFTNKLEGMFRDMDLSKTHLAEWRQWAIAKPALQQLELSVHVLSKAFWPTYAEVKVVLPPALLAAQALFGEFYQGKFDKARNLSWMHMLGYCSVRAALPRGVFTLETSLFQALVLVLFNGAGVELTYAAIQEATGLREGDFLLRTIQSLALAKKEQRLLVRTYAEDPGSARPANVPGPRDRFAVDVEWTSKMKKLKLRDIQAVESKKDTEASYERVHVDRQYQIDAIIVRIMKARKRLSHALLVTEVARQLPFVAKPADLKKRIENLIEREYVERDETDPNTYNYMA